ncbi:hypothetical protein LUZ60_016689 [Juncus effusus]|nr:hypothetical protein LUZ60_016689 [Juncus effusus]
MLSDRRIEQAIVALKKGANLLKCGKRGKPKLCPFWLSADEKMLIWYSDKKEKHLNLSSISNIVRGQKTVNFQRERWPEKEPQSLSLIYDNGECSIDLICKDKEQAESWFLGLTSLTTNTRNPKPLSDFRSNQQNTSCIYSPASFIRRKNKFASTHQDSALVPTIQNPVKFSKVRSLYGSPRCVQSRYFSDNAFDSSSEIFFSPRLRHGLEIESFLEKFVPHLPPPVPNALKSSVHTDLTKDWKMSLVKSNEEASLVLHKGDNLKDIFMWGNTPGNIFDNKHGKKADSSLPKLLDSVQSLQIQKIICGESHAALVTKQGEVFSWGEEKSGRLGHKTNINISHPKTIETLSNSRINTLALGAKHTCVLTTSGQLYTWGENMNGENEKNGAPWFPHLICDNICVSKVSCGDWHTCIISSSGSLYTFGDGTFGLLGHGDTKSISKPKQVESLKGLRVKSVACGPYHTAAVVEIIINNFKSNNPGGKLFTWGDGDGGKLGHKDGEKKLVPTCVAGLVDQDFVQVSCGNFLTVGLTVSGVVFTMGSKIHGQLGNPTAQDSCITCVDGPLKTEYVKEISSGSFHVAVLTSSGKIFTWGKGSDGQLGLGNFVNKSCPSLVEALGDRKAESISCGSNFTAVVCLHKYVSSKDHTICNGCKTVFGFTKKKHNCYNCGCTCCNSCSGNKILKAALAPDRSRRYRVCDQCFSQFENNLETSLKMDKVDKIWSEIRTYTPKVSRIFKEGGLIDEKMRSTNGVDQKKLEPQFLGGGRRWGQVDRPKCFSETGPIYFSDKKTSCSSDTDKRAKDVILYKDVSFVDNILSQEIKLLRQEVAVLIEQCQQKCSRIQQNRRKIEETCSFARDESSNCKALNDVVNLLVSQRDVLSENLSSKPDVLISKESIYRTTCSDHETMKNHSVTKVPNFGNTNETTKEVERGVYVTLCVCPNGKKSLKRVRFSRKHFNEEEAKQWWTDNGSHALQRYNADPLNLN